MVWPGNFPSLKLPSAIAQPRADDDPHHAPTRNKILGNRLDAESHKRQIEAG